jgi:ferredoxin-type protein NapG
LQDDRKGRREFLVRPAAVAGRVGLAAALVAGYATLRGGKDAPSGTRPGLGIVRPPGSLDEDAFLATCIRCTRCADSCEGGCIRFFGAEISVLQLTPYISPIDKGCTLCLQCGGACPSGAILPLEKKEDADMGVAIVDKRLCVSHNGTGICGACHTACPVHNKAIVQGLRNAPEIVPEHCTGCGLCEEHCIVDERPGLRAVQVFTERKITV